MRHSFILLSLAGLLNACNPQVGPRVTFGPPPSKALKTTELAADATQRLNILSSQTNLSNNSLFSAYRPNAVSSWNGGWTRSLDFTGVSWTRKQAGTAITPRHIVFAAHFIPKSGTPLTFHDRSGNVHKRKVVKLISFRGRKAPEEYRSDIAVALLDSPLPPSIKTYRLLPPRTDYERTLIGSPVIVTEQGRRAFINKIRAFHTKEISFAKNENVPANLYKSLIVGDSGHPSFFIGRRRTRSYRDPYRRWRWERAILLQSSSLQGSQKCGCRVGSPLQNPNRSPQPPTRTRPARENSDQGSTAARQTSSCPLRNLDHASS